ncbi:MAG: indolepyruvate oxidoreductase subunit beta [Oscillibacter sp.]|nr:indolepyruvate oxidoreductase subunit beta [Oscillibacter sp.]
MERKSALLVGVGGQGAILAAKILVAGLMEAGYDVKMSEVHGMSQRGGSVSTQVHWGEKAYSPVIGPGAADIVVAFEKMEAVRYAEFLKPEGVAVINDYEIPSSTVAAGLAEYPQGCLEAMKSHFRCLTLNAGAIALELGNAKCMNVVLFGAMTRALGMDDIDWEAVIRRTVPAASLELNLRAYRAGREAVG